MASSTEASGRGDVPPPRPVIARRVEAGRRRLGWTREALAYHSGLSWSAIAQIESGRRGSPRPETLAALARALNVPLEYLLGEPTAPALIRHRALLFGSEEEFFEATVPFLREGIERTEAVLVVATPESIDRLRGRLGAQAAEVRFEDAASWYSTPMAALRGFWTFAQEMIESGFEWVRILGGVLASTESEDDVRRWVTYESVFNSTFRGSPMTAVCPYDTRSSDPRFVDSVRDAHPELLVGEAVLPNDAHRPLEDFLLEPR